MLHVYICVVVFVALVGFIAVYIPFFRRSCFLLNVLLRKFIPKTKFMHEYIYECYVSIEQFQYNKIIFCFVFWQLPCIIWLVMKQQKRWSFHWIASWVNEPTFSSKQIYIDYVIT